MKVDYGKLESFIKTAISLRKDKKAEDVLRHNLSSWMPQIFTENSGWVTEHIYGTEEKTAFASISGTNRGFVDSLVGKTAIEYERDLRIPNVYLHGKSQVYDYCAGELNKGSAVEDIIGILSDTVWWYAFRVQIKTEPEKGKLYGRENLDLIEIDHVCLDEMGEAAGAYWSQFMDKYLGRIGSRYLSAEVLARDFGIESLYCRNNIGGIHEIIKKAFKQRPEYARMIRSLWVDFVSYVGGITDYFSIESYVNEFYIITMAKVLCANIICGKGLVSSDDEIISILNGRFFRDKGFLNFVEYDYFGWINDTPYVCDMIPDVRSIQKMLLVYDYVNIQQEDMFGRLVSQLAIREQRILLGQEETPQWLAGRIVKRALERVKGEPHIIDMCCGSGVFLVEMLKQTESSDMAENLPVQGRIQLLVQSILGFDVDPLAVMLARANWMIFMKKYIPYSDKDGFIIPVFHADSLFVKTPVTDYIENDYRNQLQKLNFGGKTIILPKQLLLPQNRRIYTYMVEQCHTIAGIRAGQNRDDVGRICIKPIIDNVLDEISSRISSDEIDELERFAEELVCILEDLQRKGLDGIWAYILNNTYRPALVNRQFNGIISNPPWLAMSKLKDNPYKEQLLARADGLQLKPYGSSSLHLELATIFLLQSINHYLRPDSIFACIVPHSVLSGYQHEPFRKIQYQPSKTNSGFNISEIWEVDQKTFKNKAVVLFGDNRDNEIRKVEFSGKYVGENYSLDKHYITLVQGKRSSWTNNLSAKVLTEALDHVCLKEGADIMFRTLIFFNAVREPNGRWSLKSILRTDRNLYYLISDLHGHKGFQVNTKGIHDKCMYKCYLSKHLVQFQLDNPADAFLPVTHGEGRWRYLQIEECAALGLATSDLVQKVVKEGNFKNIEDYYKKRLNFRNKLSEQIFPENSFLIVSSAGGAYPCSAYIRITKELEDKLIIDQTLYWMTTDSEKEALYIVGMLNSRAIAKGIEEFQPEGLQGRRHVHTIPFDIIPRYEDNSDAHNEVVSNVKKLISELVNEPLYCNMIKTESGNLQMRRNNIRKLMAESRAAIDYENACGAVLGL